jgi:hypothetical protein
MKPKEGTLPIREKNGRRINQKKKTNTAREPP